MVQGIFWALHSQYTQLLGTIPIHHRKSIILHTYLLDVTYVTSDRIFSNIEEHQYYSLKQVHVGVHSDTVGNMLQCHGIL